VGGVSEDSVKAEVEVEDGVAGSEEAVLVRLFLIIGARPGQGRAQGVTPRNQSVKTILAAEVTPPSVNLRK
jgi:hypothetical protein